MKYGAREMAKALFAATRNLDDKAARAAVRRFADDAARRYGAARLAKVLAALPEAADEAEGRRKATVETARKLSEAVLQAAVASVGLDPKYTVVTAVVKPELIGGVRVRLNDRVLDATVKRRLDAFRRAAASAE